MSKKTVASIYNPKNQSPGELIEHFIVRKRLFEKLFADIKSAKMTYPEQHYLLEGKCGMGKTTLLLRLAYAVENDPELSQWLIPINFNEEEYSIRKLFRFWERLLQMLADKEPHWHDLSNQMEQLSKQHPTDDEYERALFELLTTILQKHGKKVLLFIDNFGDMFQKFTDLEAHRLRKILQSSADLRIIAASSVVLEAFYQYNHPFYEFFKVERLEGLDTEQTKQLLLQLGKLYRQNAIDDLVANQPGRIEALRRLTGGVTRTIILLFEIFADDHNGNSFIDLEKVLDRVTPLYKHRMDDLSPPQQEVVETIALNWDAISVREIQQQTRIESKLISALLQQLTKHEIVTKIKTHTKNHLYQISERFFNIWYLMRNGRNSHRQKVLWLVRFLEQWCNASEIEARTQQHIDQLQKGNYHPHGAIMLSEALALTHHLSSQNQHRLLGATRHFLEQTNKGAPLIQSDIELMERATYAVQQKNYNLALNCLMKMKDKNDFAIGWTYHNGKRDFDKAEKHYRRAARQGHPAALNNLGVLYERIHGKPKKAESFYKKAADHQLPDALYNLGLFYKNQKQDFAKAEQCYLEAIKNKPDKDILFNLANLYANHLHQPDDAIAYYKAAIAKGQMQAMSNLAYLYLEEYQSVDEATHYFKMAIENGLLYSDDFITICEEYPVNFHFLYLMAAGESEFLYRHFNTDQAGKKRLKDRLKPIYYTALYFLKDDYPAEWLRMGDELEETVMELVDRVRKMGE